MAAIALVAQSEDTLRAQLTAACEALGWDVLDAPRLSELEDWVEEAGLLVYDPDQADAEPEVELRFLAYAEAPERPPEAAHMVAPFEDEALRSALPSPVPVSESTQALKLEDGDIEAAEDTEDVDAEGPTTLSSLPGPASKLASEGRAVAAALSEAGAPSAPPPPVESLLSPEALAAMDGGPEPAPPPAASLLSPEALAAMEAAPPPAAPPPPAASLLSPEALAAMVAAPGRPEATAPPPPEEPEPDGLEPDLTPAAALDPDATPPVFTPSFPVPHAPEGAQPGASKLQELMASSDLVGDGGDSDGVELPTGSAALDPGAFPDTGELEAIAALDPVGPPVAGRPRGSDALDPEAFPKTGEFEAPALLAAGAFPSTSAFDASPAPQPEDPDPTPLAFSPFDDPRPPRPPTSDLDDDEEIRLPPVGDRNLRNRPSGMYAVHRPGSRDLPYLPLGEEPPPAAPVPSTPPSAALRLPQRADLRQTPFARLFGAAVAAQVSGALMLRREEVKKLLYFNKGRLISIRSNLVSECLGELMVQQRLITPQERDRSLDLRKQGDRPQGQVLIEMGSISEANLSFVLDLQLQFKLQGLFSWSEGEAFFAPGRLPARVEVEAELDPLSLLHAGVQAMKPARVDGALAADRAYKLRPGPGLAGAIQTLEPDAVGLLAWIDGTRSLGELLDNDSLGSRERHQLIYALICAGALELIDAPPLSAQPAAAAAPSERPAIASGTSIPALEGAIEPPLTVARRPSDRVEQEQLHERALALEAAGPLDIFGLGAEFSEQALASAYARVRAENAPAADCVDYGARIWAERAEQRVRQAYLQLRDPAGRRHAAAQLEDAPAREARLFRVQAEVEAALKQAEGEEFLGAVEALDRALAARPDDARLQVERVWAAYRTDLTPGVEAVSALDALAERNPMSVVAQLRRAQVLEAEGHADDAKVAYAAALALDPDLPEAQMKQWTLSGSPSRRPGLFSIFTG